MKSMHINQTVESKPQTIDKIDADFYKIRNDVRIVLWMVSAGLVMMSTIFVGVFFMGLPR